MGGTEFNFLLSTMYIAHSSFGLGMPISLPKITQEAFGKGLIVVVDQLLCSAILLLVSRAKHATSKPISQSLHSKRVCFFFF